MREASLDRMEGQNVLRALQDMPDQAVVWVFIASRPVSAEESRRMVGLMTTWLEGWSHFYPSCPVSVCEPLFGGQVLIWAIDDRPRFTDDSQVGLSGTELDPLYRSLEAFANEAKPPLRVYPNMGLVVGDEIIPMDRESCARFVDLLLDAERRTDVRLINMGTIAEWRADKLIRPLTDFPELLDAVRDRRKEDIGGVR